MLRVRVTGDNETATVVRGTLQRGGFVVTDAWPRIAIEIVEADVPQPILDGVDSELERHLLAAVADRTPSGQVLIQRAGGVRSDQAMRITVPARDEERVAMETALLRGLDRYARGGRRRWWRR